jgi:hypothetical protein
MTYKGKIQLPTNLADLSRIKPVANLPHKTLPIYCLCLPLCWLYDCCTTSSTTTYTTWNRLFCYCRGLYGPYGAGCRMYDPCWVLLRAVQLSYNCCTTCRKLKSSSQLSFLPLCQICSVKVLLHSNESLTLNQCLSPPFPWLPFTILR